MKPSVKNSVITVALLAILGGGIYYSATDRKTEVANQAALQLESKRNEAMVELTGFIALDVEPFFNDPEVIRVLEKNNFRAKTTRIGSREMASKITKDAKLDFFMPSGVVAGNQISDAAKKSGFATAVYSPFYTPMVIASWAPIAKILTANKIAAADAESKSIYNVDLAELTKTMSAKKRWNDLKNNTEYDVSRSVLISTTDVRKSNSAAMYLALTSYAINKNETISDLDTARKVALDVTPLFKRQGYQESYVNGNFDDYVSIGIGKTPMAFIYENQLVSYAIAGKTIDKEMVLMYPKPTIFNKVVVVTMNEKSKAFAELLGSDPTLIEVATKYGFRTANSAPLVEKSKKANLAIKPRIVDVVDPPSFEIMSAMIDVITEQMKN